MNDYDFGNKILELRTQLNLSQTELSEMLGVTNKAVSKWETGKSKPTTNVIRKLAALFKIDINELLSMRDEERKMEISKIVITGGPCAGKSTAMSWVQNAFTQMGYTVLFVPETATELITGGVAPWTCGTNAEYQKCQLKLQIEKENIFEQAARTMAADKVLIVCDRGTLDNKAYMDDTAAFEADWAMTQTKVIADIPAAGHTLTKTEAKAPTCTEAGNEAYWTCGTCGKYFSDGEGKEEITLDSTVLSALGHDYKDGVCTRCDGKDPDYVPPTEPDAPAQTGESPLLPALAVLMILSAAALLWTGRKRQQF